MATRKVNPTGSVGLAHAHLLGKPSAVRDQPSAELSPGAAHPTPSGVGPLLGDALCIGRRVCGWVVYERGNLFFFRLPFSVLLPSFFFSDVRMIRFFFSSLSCNIVFFLSF